MFLLVSCASNTLTFQLENITKIELRDGNNGNTVSITDKDRIQTLIQPFNENEFIKNKSSKDSAGWKYWIKFYQDDKIIIEINNVSSNMIDYNGYFYDIKDGTINTDFYDELLT